MLRALLFLLLVLSAFAPGQVAAQQPPNTCGSGSTCTKEQAYSVCMALVTWYVGAASGGTERRNPECWTATPGNSASGSWNGRLETRSSPTGTWTTGAFGQTQWRVACPANTQWDELSKTCKDTRCPNIPQVPTNPSREGWTWCQTQTDSTGTYSCEVVGIRALPTQPFAGYVVGGPTGGKCDPNNYTCPNGYRKQADGPCQPIPACPDGVPVDAGTGECTQPAECPPGKAKNAEGECVPEKNLCPVGQVKAPDGSCAEDENQCGAGQVKGDDGSCKEDANGDGEPDEESDEHQAEDSPRCDVAPKCSGDEIMCLHAKQLWRIDCNTRKARNVIMGEYCQKMPVCESVALGDDDRNVGCDAVEEAALIQQWRTACATSEMLELMKKGGTSGGDSGTHSRLDAIKNFLDGNGQQLDQPAVPFIEQPIESQQWDSGLGGNGTCPAPISTTVTIGGYSAPVNFSFDPLCQFANYLYAVVVTMGGLMAAFIIAGVRK